jgi:23S rRNA (cytidine1920-2'-O)/16S rRNA (cytidine1409-2'-O)-methyltransferase
LSNICSVFTVDVKDKVILDIGASTGGFTDCALQHGAKMSYALDVGYNQLAWKLRQDERVVVMERTNFRYVTPAGLTGEMPNFATIDVSFISLTLILPVLKTLLVKNSDIVALIKPQFEAGREQVGKKGIVRDSKVHLEVINKMISFSILQGYSIMNLSFSPITGGDGNIEFLLHLRWEGERERGENHLTVTPDEIVEQSHFELKSKSHTDEG